MSALVDWLAEPNGSLGISSGLAGGRGAGGGSGGTVFGAADTQRLFAALDRDGTGHVTYPALAHFLAGANLGRPQDLASASAAAPLADLPGRLAEVLAALRDQLKPLRGARPQAVRRVADMCAQLDGARSGRLSGGAWARALDGAGLALPRDDAQVMAV